MRYLFFIFVFNVCACAANNAARTSDKHDNTDLTKALAIFNVSTTGTGYADDDSVISIQCVSSVGDAALDAKAALRSAHEEIVKIRCGAARANNFVPEDLILSLSGHVSCIKIAVKVFDVKCQAGQ